MRDSRDLFRRRRLLKAMAAGSIAMVAGCSGNDPDETADSTTSQSTSDSAGQTTAATSSGETTTATNSGETTTTDEDPGTTPESRGPPAVDLGSAGNYSILAKSGISSVPASVVTGDIGVSPIDSTAITGFSLTMDSSGEYATSNQVDGRVFASDYAAPTPSKLTSAVSDMESAYNDAAGRNDPDATELGGGDISGMTFEPGLYKWGTGVSINEDVTLNGGADDTWIFQIAGELTVASDTQVVLSGDASAGNIVWQVGERTVLGTGAQFAGTVLTQTGVDARTGATVNGRLYAQTDVTLEEATITG